MTDLLNVDGQPISATDNVKQSILVIERFCFALNQMSVPARFCQNFLEGFSFLNQMHTQLLAQLTPEQIEAMKREVLPVKEGAN